ncbi:M1 family metallopeptidase [Candidatus Woesearchaeota archaeon]|nr:M1 family metallopeptidase [Candidatus Woesearchaeota archaeon]
MPKEVKTTLNFNVIPSHYLLHFHPNLKTFKFSAQTEITVQVKKLTKIITLHSKELKITTVLIQQNNSVQKAKIKLDVKKEELALTFSKSIKGHAKLLFTYTGKHNNGMYGFYRSQYTVKGKKSYLLTTQFESASARAAFPCFDEPVFKATFDVLITTEKNLFTISNMPIKKELDIKTKKQVIFQTSPKMSTYLLYLGIGNFSYISAQTKHTLIRVITTHDQIKYAHLALAYTKKFLDFFEKYFQIPYPLPKLDLIAIPDFASGAMENWGAITFREIALLGDEHTSVVVKQNIAITISHELVHQWFGNLVTMQWWDDLWLNESFATYMSYKAVDHYYPEWELPLQYYEDTINNALNADQLCSTHPINVDVKTPGEVAEIFDHISYDKGGSVLHMLEHFVSEKVFRAGLYKYLKKYSYQNATKYDLWNSIQQVYKKNNLSKIMQTWINQPGYPLITVKQLADSYQLTQQTFSLIPSESNEKWLIPINYQNNVTPSTFLMQERKHLLKDKSPWLKLNTDQHGFYRVKYDTDMLPALGGLLKEKKLSLLDSAGLESDLFSLTLAGEYSLEHYLQFLERYCLDSSYPLNFGVSSHLGYLFRLTYHKDIFIRIKNVSIKFHAQQLEKIGWHHTANESNTNTMLRSLAIANLGLANHNPTLTKINQLFSQLKDKQPLDANIRGVVYNLIAWQGSPEIYDYLLDRYKKETLPEENRKLLRALGMFHNKELLKKSLHLSQSSTVRLQDSFVIPLSVSMNPNSGSLIWHWTKDHWSGLLKKHDHGTHMLSNMVHNLSIISDLPTRKEIEIFFKNKKNYRDDIKMVIKQTLEQIDININFLRRNGL